MKLFPDSLQDPEGDKKQVGELSMNKLMDIAINAKRLKENGYQVKVVGGKGFKMIFAGKKDSSLEIYIADDVETAQGIFRKNSEFYLEDMADENSGFEMDSGEDFFVIYDRETKHCHKIKIKANYVYMYHGSLSKLAENHF